MAMHLLMDTALMAPIRAWTKRAEQLLEGQPVSTPHAWIAVARSYERIFSGDFEGARPWAQLAIEAGDRLDPAAAAMGRMAKARSLIFEGDVVHGLDLLNENAVSLMSGELDPVITGALYCELVCAVQALGRYDLADEWTEATERWRHGRPIGSMHGRCRVHRAEILNFRGLLADAEKEAQLACEELRPYLRRELGWPLKELGRIRLRRGDLEGARAALTAAAGLGWDPEPALASVHLAQGDPTTAAAAIRRALEHPLGVPSKELPPHTDLRRAPLLEVQVQAEIATGNVGRAREAADELARIAAVFEGNALPAAAAHADGSIRLAEGDADGALRRFCDAARLWTTAGAPYETALARLGAGRAYRAQGNEPNAILELEAAATGFRQVGSIYEAGQVEDALRESGNRTVGIEPAVGRRDSSGDQIFRCEGEYWSIVYEGQTTRLRDLKGLRYLALLLSHPGRDFHVFDLAAPTSAQPAPGGPGDVSLGARFVDAGPLLDSRAKAAYRRRLADIQEDIDEATSMGDTSRAEQARTEREFLLKELSRAVGLGGRDRRASLSSERARVSVTRALRLAIERISQHHPKLGEHLCRSVRTGTYCAYMPDCQLPTVWRA